MQSQFSAAKGGKWYQGISQQSGSHARTRTVTWPTCGSGDIRAQLTAPGSVQPELPRDPRACMGMEQSDWGFWGKHHRPPQNAALCPASHPYSFAVIFWKVIWDWAICVATTGTRRYLVWGSGCQLCNPQPHKLRWTKPRVPDRDAVWM